MKRKCRSSPQFNHCDRFISKGSPERLKGFLAPMHSFLYHLLAQLSPLHCCSWPQPYGNGCSATRSCLAKLRFPISQPVKHFPGCASQRKNHQVGGMRGAGTYSEWKNRETGNMQISPAYCKGAAYLKQCSCIGMLPALILF